MAEAAHTITGLQAQKRNRQRVNVYLDGEFAFGLSRVVAAWLRVGQMLSLDKIETLKAQDSQEAAYQQALRYLSYRDRSLAEISANLKEHGYAAEAIDHAMERLKEQGLADDQRFGRLWAENRSEFRPRSRRLLAFELRQKGLEGEAIEEALNGLDDSTLAVEAANKQARKLKNLAWPEFRQKMVGFLGRRGFNYATASEAAARAWEGLNDPPINDTDEEEVN